MKITRSAVCPVPSRKSPGEEVPDRETAAAIEEVEELKRRPDKKSYADFEDLLEDLNSYLLFR